MRTAELIALLRSHDRSHPKTKELLATLDDTRQLHLLGELSNWLLSEIQKYKEKQLDHSTPESPQQGSIRRQIRHTLLAIQVLIDSTVSVSETSTHESANTSKPVVFDEKAKAKVMERFLRPILIGIAPLSPCVDSTDVQILCAKVLCYCTNSSNNNAPFDPQVLIRKMMAITDNQIQQKGPPTYSKQRTNFSTNASIAVSGIAALLQSPMIKLQEYALKILTAHRLIVQLDQSWELLIPLKSILKTLKDNITSITTDQPVEPFGQDLGVIDTNLELTKPSVHGNRYGGVVKVLEDHITIRYKALNLLQWFLQETGRFSGASKESLVALQNTQDRTSRSIDHRNISRKLEILKEAADVVLLTDLWKAVQDVVLFDKAKLAAISERLVLLTTASIYWVCWIFQDTVLNYIILNASDTLMAWYGYYIVSHDQTSAPTQTPKDIVQEQTELKQKSSIVEYLSKMIQNIVSSKARHQKLFAGDPPIGIVIMRRTIEFLEGILESGQLNFGVDPAELGQDTWLSGGSSETTEAKSMVYPMAIIREKPGILEAMLSIVVNCYGNSREGNSIVLDSQLLNILLLLLSDIQSLFSIQNLSESTSRKLRQLSLTMMHLIMKHDDYIPGINDIPINHWTIGYQALIDMVLLPLESELATVPEQNIDIVATREKRSKSSSEEVGIKALKLFIQFWKHHYKGRNMLSDLLAPRLHRLEMIPVIMGNQQADSDDGKWRRERTLLLLETIVRFGKESSVRINMRERWFSLPFLVAILGSSIKRLESNGFSLGDSLSRMVAKRCFLAMRNFWFDRLGLVQMIELDINPSESELWIDMMPLSVQPKRQSASAPLSSSPLQTSPSSSSSVVPLLLAIISPPGIDWSSGPMLPYSRSNEGPGQRPRHPLFDGRDQILVEAAVMLAQLSQFPECQERLVSKPGVIWMLSRMMVERSLVSSLEQGSVADTDVAETEETPHELLEKALFETLTKVTSSEKLAKSLVSNNSMTELFAAIMEMDSPMYFYSAKNVIEVIRDKTDADHVDLKSDICENQILPTLHQYVLHQRLLQHFQTAMVPIRGQFERIYQYIGGGRPILEIDDTTETFYWLRENCALVFSYTLDPPNNNSSLIWGSKVDREAVLDSESILGVICKMLTLEMEYDDDPSDAATIQEDLTTKRVELIKAQQEDALRRRFSSGLAIQSLCWRHAEEWRRQHLELLQSYSTVTTVEWEIYASTLKGDGTTDSSSKNLDSVTRGIVDFQTAVDFIIQDRVISFPDRAVLSRTSIYFHALLMGDFKEASQKHIQIQDVDPDDFELLIEVIKESQFTALFILPDDLPLAVVLRLLICADKYMVVFVKRLVEAWILKALGARELKYYETRWSDSEGQHNNAKHPHDSIPVDESPEKKRKLDGDNVIDEALRTMGHKDENKLTEPAKVVLDESVETIQESLLMVFEVCSKSHYGNLYSTAHPFFGIVWDVLKRMALRLGSIASTPRFITMLNDGGEERIQEFLKVLYDLITNNVTVID
ncbi:hypothetical protein BGZ76_010222 [Entomortierella beljakovae]|nr:hypothetical protein BGZ76_010222 [Entomortierella beljakovae]